MRKNVNRLTICSLVSLAFITKSTSTAISNISELDVLYTKGPVTQKRKIIGSMFPEKLTFDGFQYRTPRVIEAIILMMLIHKKLEGKKMGQKSFIF